MQPINVPQLEECVNDGPFSTKKGQKVHLLNPHGNKVGYGNVHNGDPTGTFHGSTIGEGNLSIEVMICNFSGYMLPIPNGDATTLGKALWGFKLWETKSL